MIDDGDAPATPRRLQALIGGRQAANEQMTETRVAKVESTRECCSAQTNTSNPKIAFVLIFIQLLFLPFRERVSISHEG